MITIGLFTYFVVHSCITMGKVSFPLSDQHGTSRMFYVCDDYNTLQKNEVVIHELFHACLENHSHNFQMQKELDRHLASDNTFSSEELATTVGSCVASALVDPAFKEETGVGLQ